MSHKKAILTTAFFGPIRYFLNFSQYKTVLIEQFDSYTKQTYRNRCVIGGSGGPLTMSIPVKKQKKYKTLVKDIRIDYDTCWQKIHFRSIISCYNSTPFFEYLRDDIEPFFSKKYVFLIDLNTDSSHKICELLGLKTEIKLTNEYLSYENFSDVTDFREHITPKKTIPEDILFYPKPYHQVFESKRGFIPNLSILDLLFNTGQEAAGILKSCGNI